MSNIPNSEPNQGFHPNNDRQNHELPQGPSSSETPQKRRPGRPKGSTKKTATGDSQVPKMKRPVGRPRKDGFPAGSVTAPRPRPVKRPRHSTGVSYMSITVHDST